MTYFNESRREYSKYTFDKDQALEDPFDQFSDWFEFARKTAMFEQNSMMLSTVVNNQPSSRIVLLKQFSQDGFVFFSNYNSNKSQEMDRNPQVALTFYWPNVERQIHIQGVVDKLSVLESDQYFETRPRESQLSAWASDQSKEINDRDALEEKLDYFNKKFPQGVPRPDFWGGFIVTPKFFEFWQGRENRYHDRICYELTTDDWRMFRLNP